MKLGRSSAYPCEAHAIVTDLLLRAPFAGWVTGLDQVDDPVFAERMIGEGVAIEPLEGLVRAPAAAEVIALAPTGHSITLRLENGCELLIHIGLETVGLGGRGFEVKTRPGAKVAVGEPLIAFDIETVWKEAKSLVTPIVFLTEGCEVQAIAVNRPVAAGDTLMRVVGPGGSDSSSVVDPASTVRLETVVPLAHGIHARPAARIAAALKEFAADVRLEARGRSGNARSTVALLTLGIKRDDRVSIIASGSDAQQAADAVQSLIASGMGETAPLRATSAQPDPSVSTGPRFAGVCASAGLAVGPVVHLQLTNQEIPRDATSILEEQERLRAAMDAVRSDLDEGRKREPSGIAFAHRAILDDPELAAAASRHVEAGRSAAFAWRSATQELAEQIRQTGDSFLVERIDDLVDVERRIIAKTVGGSEPGGRTVPESAIIVAESLLPSEFMALPIDRVGGFVCARGGATSHVAILAASAGVPMLVAAGLGVMSVPEGTIALLDATAGVFDSAATEESIASTRETIAARSAIRLDQHRAAQADCLMADGIRIEVFANVGSLEDASRASALGAEGCGLLRTEFLFLDRQSPPTEDEQKQAYGAIAQALRGKPLIVRTLDIGGDKPVPYLEQIQEDNPALGRRGVRFSLARPDLLATQFRAILLGVPENQCRIMVPMIVDVAELRAVRAILDTAARAVGVRKHIPLGVMIETPSAAILADNIAIEADFLSVGTNDLSQYCLAVDRGNEAVAGMVDALHPAVLRLIGHAGKAANKEGRPLGICGGLASEPQAAAILIGLGATELSVVPAAVPEIKSVVRSLTREQCTVLAERAVSLGTASEVRDMIAGG